MTRRHEQVIVAAAVLIAHLFYWRAVRYPSDFDARNYFAIADDIIRNGLFSRLHDSDYRTYGYPFFLAALTRIADALRVSRDWLVFEVQLAIYLAAASFLSSRLRPSWPQLASYAFTGLTLNAFALLYTAESLTESISLSLILVAGGCWLALLANSGRCWPVIAGSVVVGAAVMIRPANLFALLAWVFAVGSVYVARGATVRMMLVCAAVIAAGALAPMLPQYVNNLQHYGQHSPLVVSALGRSQQAWGISYLKYATALPPVPYSAIYYHNPFASTDSFDRDEPLRWYWRNPVNGALTAGLHVFNMLDQDLVFTYSRDLDPWYRVPVGIVNHAIIGTALIGIGMLLAGWRRSKECALAATALVAYLIAHTGLHATAAVEMRFGLPLLLFSWPAALAAASQLAERRVTTRSRVLAAIGVATYVALAMTLSDWVRQQAPAIRAWEARQPAAG